MGSFTSPGIDTKQKGPPAFSVSSERHRQMWSEQNCLSFETSVDRIETPSIDSPALHRATTAPHNLTTSISIYHLNQSKAVTRCAGFSFAMIKRKCLASLSKQCNDIDNCCWGSSGDPGRICPFQQMGNTRTFYVF